MTFKVSDDLRISYLNALATLRWSSSHFFELAEHPYSRKTGENISESTT